MCNGQEEYFDSDTARLSSFSLPQSPIFDILMQTMAPNYYPSNPTDLFDILRDRYDLPIGNINSIIYINYILYIE